MQHVKVVVVGDSAVGKTSMLISYTSGVYPKEYVPTVFDNLSTLLVVDETPYDISLYDTAGHEGYDRLRPIAYPSTNIFLVCFSIDSQDSYNNVGQKWIPEIQHHCPQVPFILVGTKADLRNGEKTNKEHNSSPALILSEKGTALATKLGAAQYIECSAYTQDGLKELFVEAVRSVVQSDKHKKNKFWCNVL